MTDDLTPRQRQILEFIQDAIAANGLPPTRAEIAEALGFRSANAAEEHVEGRFQIDPALFSPRPHYLLRVSGMSMRDVGILDGDLVAVHRSPDVRNRQIIVARLENEVTVKRYRQEGSVVWLMPENPDFEPIRVDLRKQSMTIEGVVVGVLRRGRPDVMQ